MKKYVLGFAFNYNRELIVVIKKNRPEWQAGKINGIGGKIEDGETGIIAMVREFYEETGVLTSTEDWDNFGSMIFENDIMGGSAEVLLYRMFSDKIYYCETKEDEEIIITNYEFLNLYHQMHNLPILVPLALSKEFKYTKLNG